MLTDHSKVQIDKSRIYYQDGLVRHFYNPQVAFAIYLSLPKGVKVAFRSAGDTTPVYSHDYVDQL